LITAGFSFGPAFPLLFPTPVTISNDNGLSSMKKH